ncbi:hypothetical protein VTP01DRAFT_8870 [Rhizomucor pusillus]|uniref:uncharacterized protein n=1 Tax=Rhizomucor pusillus TaxID=4840 RepID=UPI0037420942
MSRWWPSTVSQHFCRHTSSGTRAVNTGAQGSHPCLSVAKDVALEVSGLFLLAVEIKLCPNSVGDRFCILGISSTRIVWDACVVITRSTTPDSPSSTAKRPNKR